jgi:hypothetical protein
MLDNVGVIPFKNNKERKILFRKLRNEFGLNCEIWVENYLLFYQFKVSPDVMYL